MDELLSRLSLAGVGCYVGTRFYGALCYADDLTLLCPSRRSMNIMLKICEDFALEYGVKFNSTKSVLITYNVEIDVCFMLNNAPIVQSESALHLGHYIGKDCNQKNISLGFRNLIGRTNTMLYRFSYCSSFIKSTLFKTYCTSYYGCVLWRLDSSAVQKFYVSWRKIIRRIWGLPYRTHCRFLPILVSENPPETQLLLRFSKFLFNAINSDNLHVSMCAKLCYFSNTPVAANGRMLMQQTNNTTVYDKVNLCKLLTHAAKCSAEVQGLGNCLKELCGIRDGDFMCDLDSDDINLIIDNICCT